MANTDIAVAVAVCGLHSKSLRQSIRNQQRLSFRKDHNMNFALKSIALAMLVATTELAGVAYAQAPKAPAAPVVQPSTAATKAPIPTKAPEDWIMFDGTTYTPVVDAVSRHQIGRASCRERV